VGGSKLLAKITKCVTGILTPKATPQDVTSADCVRKTSFLSVEDPSVSPPNPVRLIVEVGHVMELFRTKLDVALLNPGTDPVIVVGTAIWEKAG
jgi:hypothetical protein